MPGNIPFTKMHNNNSSDSSTTSNPHTGSELSRRRFIKNSAGFSALSLAGAASLLSGCDDTRSHNEWAEFFQKNYRVMSDSEKADAVHRLEARYAQAYGKNVKVGTEPAQADVLFGAALNVQKCIGCRRCVKACSAENNPSRSNDQSKRENIEWIRVIEIGKPTYEAKSDAEDQPLQSDSSNVRTAEQLPMKPVEGNHYYATNSEDVPASDSHYMPISCMQCENPPCVKVCPVNATYKEPDGIVVIDYNWCIGCRMCVQACPYWARRFNWSTPNLPTDEMNPDTHYLGNRPRMKGVVEKCTFCIQRVRKGRYPACVEVCPTGARKFGNLLDPNSDVRQVLANKRVFQLKAELNTEPKFFYFMD